MKLDHFKDDFEGFTRLFFKSLEERVEQLEKEVESLARKQGVEDAIHHIRNGGATTSDQSNMEDAIRKRIQPLYNEIVSTFAQYETEADLKSFIQEVMSTDGKRSEVLVEMTPEQQQTLLSELEAEKQRLLDHIEALSKKIARHQIEKEFQIETLGTTPSKNKKETVSYNVGMVILIILECLYNNSTLANHSSTMTNPERIATCILVALGCCLGGHLIGSELRRDKEQGERYSYLFIIGIAATLSALIFVVYLRVQDGEWYTIFAYLIFVIIAVWGGYKYTDPLAGHKKVYFEHINEVDKIQKNIDFQKDELQSVEQRIMEAEQGLYRSKLKDLNTDPKELQKMELACKQMKTYKDELISRLGAMHDHAVKIYCTAYENTRKRNS